MAGTPNSIITPQTVMVGAIAQAMVAQTDILTGAPANAILLGTAGANGGRLVRATSWPLATFATASQLALWSSIDAGVTKRVFSLIAMPAYALAATTAPPPADFGFSDWYPALLKPGELIYVSSAVAGSLGTRIEWQDF